MTESVSEITDVLTVSVGGRRAERLEGNTCVKYLKGYYDNTLCCKQTMCENFVQLFADCISSYDAKRTV